ncbi:hypothetical protein B1757_13100 [Acidithiobacillus marinus]|uniref:MPN635 N-terminal domain-containing protein n=2 Tax=Acidithiobacillus marinus TaxID=187490 RepID=A0A2I1DIW5_9PROT|nr:hypothetical protein B1757_13100 [Acidithiobacillus marinus]
MFGIGLKDALATFKRRGIDVHIESKFAGITTDWGAKEGFPDILTLHAQVYAPDDQEMNGTKFYLRGISDADITLAKSLFLQFSDPVIMDTTANGQVVHRQGESGSIYVNGTHVANEPNFLFSYNITTLTANLRKAMNRERTNVGRSAYTDIIKKILLSSKSPEVSEAIAKDFRNLGFGNNRDEIGWIEVQRHAVKVLNKMGKYLFISAEQAMENPDIMDQAKRNGLQLITVPGNLAKSLDKLQDDSGTRIRDLHAFIEEYNQSFCFDYVDAKELTKKESYIYALTPNILKLFGGKPGKVKEIRISKTMREDFFTDSDTMGCWDAETRYVVIARSALSSVSMYAGTLVHELIHAVTGQSDVTRDFENSLTDAIGSAYEKLLNKNG